MTMIQCAKKVDTDLYVKFDNGSGMWCVFGNISGFAYSTHSSEEEAMHEFERRVIEPTSPDSYRLPELSSENRRFYEAGIIEGSRRMGMPEDVSLKVEELRKAITDAIHWIRVGNESYALEILTDATESE